MRTITFITYISLIVVAFGCNKSTAPTEPKVDQHPTRILSVSVDDQIVDTRNTEAVVLTGQVLKIVITAVDEDTFAKYVITDNNSPANASVIADLKSPHSDTLRTNSNFYADTASYAPYRVKLGDVIKQKFTIVDAFGFTTSQELTIHIKE